MRRALVGHTGFVGSNLLRQATFDDCFHSQNIEEICGRSYDLLVCAGAPAEKWRANRQPDRDRANLNRLRAALGAAHADQIILISTVDVFAVPQGVDESTPVNPDQATPYGRHRYELEEFLRARFRCLVVRLPGLFGTGLKKNVIYDLLHNHLLEQIHGEAVYQFYNVQRLWQDCRTALKAGLELVHFATEPVSVAEVAREAFGFAFANRPPIVPARYDLRTRYSSLFGGPNGYLADRATVLRDLAAFVRQQRRKPCA